MYTCTYTQGSTIHALQTFLYPLMPDLPDDDSSPADSPASFMGSMLAAGSSFRLA
jgi:hypothetical protein